MNIVGFAKRFTPDELKAIGLAALMLGLGWLLHRPPVQIQERTKTVTLKVEDKTKIQALSQQIVALQSRIETLQKHTHVVKHKVTYPNGKVDETTVIDQQVAKTEQSAQSTSVHRQKTTTETQHTTVAQTTTHEKKVELAPRNWSLGLMIGFEPAQISLKGGLGLGALKVGPIAERRLGTIPVVDIEVWAGIWALTDTTNPKNTTVGGVVAGHF